MKSRQWTTSVPITGDNVSDQVPALDPGWCAARGINTSAPQVLRLLKTKVLPFIRHQEFKFGLQAFHFLIHDRNSGVPAIEGDLNPYIHMRLFFETKKAKLITPPEFRYTQPLDDSPPTVAAGVDGGLISGADSLWLLNAQSAWVLNCIQAHTWKDDGDMVRQMRQYLHYFANMTQIAAQ